MRDVQVSIPPEHVELLVGSDLLKLLAPEERRSLLVEAIKKVLDDYATRHLVLKAIQPHLEKALAEVAGEMESRIKDAVRGYVEKMLADIPKHLTAY